MTFPKKQDKIELIWKDEHKNPKNIFEVVKPFSVKTYQSQPEKVQYGPVKQSAAPRQQASGTTTTSAAAPRKNLNSKNIALSRLIGKRGLWNLPTTNFVADKEYPGAIHPEDTMIITEIHIDGFEPMDSISLQKGLTDGTISYSYDTETGKYTFKKATNGNPKNSLNQAEAQKKYQNDVLKAGYGPVDQQKFQQDIQNGKIHYTYDSDTDEYVFRKGEQKQHPSSSIPAHSIMSPFRQEGDLNNLQNFFKQTEKQSEEAGEPLTNYTGTSHTYYQGNYADMNVGYAEIHDIAERNKNAYADEKRLMAAEAFEDEAMAFLKRETEIKEGMSPEEVKLKVENITRFSQGNMYSDDAKLKWEDEELHRYASVTEECTFKYLYDTYGEEKADEYLDKIERTLQQRKASEKYAEQKEWADEHPFLGTLWNVAASIGQVGGIVEVGKQELKNMFTGEYESVNPYSAWMAPARTVQATAEGLTEDIENPVGKIFAETGLSIIQQAPNIALSYFATPAAGAALSAANAAGANAYDATMRGGTTDQVLGSAIFAGLAEYVIGKLPMEEIVDTIKAGGKEAGESIVKGVLKNGGMERSEELLTHEIGVLVDSIIMADRSNISLRTEEYIKQGLSPEKAKTKAWLDVVLIQGLENAAAGWISGITLAGGGAAINAAFGRGDSNGTNGNNVRNLPTAKEDLANGTFGNKQNVTYLPRAVQGVETVVNGDSRYSVEMGGYFPDVSLTTEGAAERYGIVDINKKSEVINKIAKSLENSYLSTEAQAKPITNIDTGMQIEIWKSGINETFGNDKYYMALSKDMKLAKIATMQDLAKLIKYGEVRSAEAGNYHNSNSPVTYAYLTAPVTIDGKTYNVNMDIRKAPQTGNRFYIHDLKIDKTENQRATKAELPRPLKVDSPSTDPIIQQNNTGVNPYSMQNSQNVASETDNRVVYQTPQESNPELLPWQKKLLEKKAELGLSVDETDFLPRAGETLASSNELRNYVGELKKFLKQYGISDVVVDEHPTSGKVPAYFDPKDGSIHLSPFLDSKEVIARKIAHEVVHPAELGDAEVVNRILSVMRQIGRDVDAEVAEHKQRYTDFFVQEKGYTPHQAKQTVTDTYAAAETAGDFLSELFGDTDLQNMLAGQNPNFVQRIVQAIRDVIRRLRGNGQNTKQLAQYQKLADDLTAAVERQTGVRAQNSIDENGFGGYNRGTNELTADDVRYAIAGEKAETANKGLLETAKDLLSNGETKENVLKQTGWFKGADNKWRFEIDDSKSVLKPLDSEKTSVKLGTIFENDALYDAYPFLKNIEVMFVPRSELVSFGDEGRAVAQCVGDRIYMTDEMLHPNSLEFSQDEIKTTVIHEIQHLIQDYEGFEGGGNPKEILEYLRNQAELYLGEIGDERYRDIVLNGTIGEYREYIDRFIKNEFQDEDLDRIVKKTYLALHGEREARAAEKRMNMSGDERLNHYPDYGEGAILRNEYLEENSSVLQKTHSDFVVSALSSLETQANIKKTQKKKYTLRTKIDDSNLRKNAEFDTRFSVDTIDADAGYLDSVMEQADRLDDSARTLPTKAVQSKKDLQQRLISDFSIPEGSKKQVNDAVEQFTKTLQHGGTIKQSDVDRLFETLYESGRVEAVDSVSESNKQVRQWFNGSKIYVPESVKAEFGDDWKDIKASAFGNRIYLVNDPNARGIDSVYEEAQNKFGVFSDDMTDSAEMLREIIHTANEGRTKYVSFAESLKSFGDDAVQDHHDTLREMFANRIETYIEKANLEMNLKEKNIQEIDSLKEHQREMRANQAERRQESELKTKTFNAVKRLRKMQKKQSPEYRVAIDEVLGNLSTVAKSLTANKEFELRDLKRWATDLEKNENFIPSPRLKRMLNELDAIHIDDLSSYELSVLSNSVFGLEHEIRNRNREIGVEKAREFSEISRKGMDELESLKSEKSHRGYEKYLSGTVKSIENLSPYRALRLLDGFRSDGELTKAAKAFEQGEFKMIDYQTKADKIFEPFMENKENVEWLKTAAGKHAKFIDKKFRPIIGIDETGTSIFGEEQTISFTPMMRVQMYLDLQNRDNLRHVVNGGYKIITKDSYGKNNLESTRPIRLSVQDLKNIVSEMSEAEKRYAALLQEYYNAYSKERINQTSMELDGYERAMEDNYYPIVSDENYLKSTAAVYDGSINGTGSLQERLHASNPILLSDADSVYRWHRDMMSRYYGLAIPIRNFEMTLNYAEKGFNGSFKEELEQTWGKNAAKYLDDLLVELNGMKAREDRGRFGGKLDAATSNTTNAVLSFNLSSLGKQFAAYPSSAAVLGWDSLAHGLKLWEKVDTDLVSAYTPLLDWRAQGYATQELADYTRTKGALPKSKLGKTLSGVNWLTAADQAVVKRLWAASEYYVKKNTDLTPGSNPTDGNDPYYKAVAEIFQDTISKTQSMSTMMHRTNISKTSKGRLVTYMKGDALQKGGFLFEKAGELNRLNREFKQNPTAENKKAFIDAKRAMARTASAFIADAAFVTLVSLAMTHDKDKWRDEEGKLTFESAGKQYIKEMAGGLSGMAVFGENIYNAIDAAFFGGTVYDAVFPGLDAGNKTFQQIIDTVGSTSDFFVGMGDIISNGGSIPEYVANEGSGAVGLLKDTAIGIGSLFGIPASNMEKYTLKALYAATPNLAAQYENFFNRTGKSDLKGLYGNKLQARLGTAISNRIKDVKPATKQEIHRLYQAENGEVIPVEVPKAVSVDGVEVTLTPYKKQVYEDTFDLTVGNSLDTLVSSDYYSSLDDNDRVKAIKYLYDYADAVAKEKSVGRPLSGWMENAKSMVDDGLNVEKYLQFKLATDEYTSEDGKVKTQKVDWLKNSGFSETSQSIIFFNSIASDKQLEACSHLADEYGVRKTDYYNFIAGTNGFEPEKNSDGKSINGSLDMKYMAYINSMNISEEQKVQMFLSSANSESLVKNFNEKVQEAKRIGINEMELAQFYCVSYATASDKDSNGETITGSKQNKVWAFIDSLDMSNAQKNFLHLCSYSAKSLGKAPWNSGRNLRGYMPSFPYIKGISSKTAKKIIQPKNQTDSSTKKGNNALQRKPTLQFLPTAKEDLAKGTVRYK